MNTEGRKFNFGDARGARDRGPGANGGVFNLLRHYALASFLCIAVAAVLLTAFYRHLEVQETTGYARKSNLNLADALLDWARPELGGYLASVANLGGKEIADVPLPPGLGTDIAGFATKTQTAKIRIYNKRGVIVFSTDRLELGRTGSDDARFATAITGQTVSDLAYRDAFSGFGPRAADDNVLSTFVPVRISPAEPVLGALATYVDLGPAAAQNEREVLEIIAGVSLICVLLYSVLLLVVLRGRKIIDFQQATINERSATLESLSVQLLAAEETEKNALAASLQNGLAQTLTAVKGRIELSMEAGLEKDARDAWLQTALRALQGAIEEVQDLATELRPPSLDELGLLPTIRWLCREFEYLHPDIQIEQQLSLQENEVPEPLKIVIYRIIEAAFKDIAKTAQNDRIRLRLEHGTKGIILAIDDAPHESANAAAAPGNQIPDPQLRFASAYDRATLSGGDFSTTLNPEGGVTLHASWLV